MNKVPDAWSKKGLGLRTLAVESGWNEPVRKAVFHHGLNKDVPTELISYSPPMVPPESMQLGSTHHLTECERRKRRWICFSLQGFWSHHCSVHCEGQPSATEHHQGDCASSQAPGGEHRTMQKQSFLAPPWGLHLALNNSYQLLHALNTLLILKTQVILTVWQHGCTHRLSHGVRYPWSHSHRKYGRHTPPNLRIFGLLIGCTSIQLTLSAWLKVTVTVQTQQTSEIRKNLKIWGTIFSLLSVSWKSTQGLKWYIED